MKTTRLNTICQTTFLALTASALFTPSESQGGFRDRVANAGRALLGQADEAAEQAPQAARLPLCVRGVTIGSACTAVGNQAQLEFRCWQNQRNVTRECTEELEQWEEDRPRIENGNDFHSRLKERINYFNNALTSARTRASNDIGSGLVNMVTTPILCDAVYLNLGRCLAAHRRILHDRVPNEEAGRPNPGDTRPIQRSQNVQPAPANPAQAVPPPASAAPTN